MGSLISLLIIFVLSVLITKIASQALMHTGLSKDASKFQARSAFTGVGFTTSEAEKIVNHPVRRRIIMALMLIGNIGIISAMASLILTFVNPDKQNIDNIIRIGIIIGSLAILYALTKSKWVENTIAKIIDKALNRFTSINVKDYIELLDLQGDYEINVLNVNKESWLSDKKIRNLGLREEGIIIIGIKRKNGAYIGSPHADTKITATDQLIVYGREKALRNLEHRKHDLAGDQEHKKAKESQSIEMKKQDAMDKQSFQ